MKRFALASALTLLPAVALASGSSAPADSVSWAGTYFGVQAGSASSDVSMTEYRVDAGTPNGYTWAGKDTDVTFAGYAGYNLELAGGLLVGVEGDVGSSNLNSLGFVLDDGVEDDSYLYGWRSGVQASLRARAGFTTGNFLLYGTGGLATSQNHFDVYAGDSNTDPEVITRTMTGWTAGVGAEYALPSNWSARLEYRYTDFGTVTNTPQIDSYGGDYNDKFKVKQNSITFGIAYRF